MKKSLVFIVALLLTAVGATAQKKVTSPVLNGDGTVTFNIKAKRAEKVRLKGSFVPMTMPVKTPAGVWGKDGSYAMMKHGNVWTFTTKPLESEIYTYYFEVDGERVIDPHNPDTVRDINNFFSRFVIEGGIADDYVQKDVPHGTVKAVWYNSSISKTPRRRMVVYTPAGYEATTDSLPVLYLLHGSGGDEKSWLRLGKAAEILDNLIAQGRCKPMIVVMPNGLVNWAATPGENPYTDEKMSVPNPESMVGKIERAFVPDIVTFIDSHYRTIPDKQHRAIAGLSLGGLHTLFTSANNPDVFDYVGLFSAQTTNALNDKRIGGVEKLAKGIDAAASVLPFLKKGKVGEKVGRVAEMISDGDLDIYENIDDKLERQFANPPALYYIALGRDDFVKKINDDFRMKLDAGGYKYVYRETDGGHTWENWRKYLVDFLPRLFNYE